MREMSGVVGHIKAHAGKQSEFNISDNHKLCVYVSGELGHSDSDHMWMQLCEVGAFFFFLRAKQVHISTTLQENLS